MRRIALVLIILASLSCDDESETYRNDVTLEVAGQSFRWRTNDGECTLRNLSTALACELSAGVRQEGYDLRFSLNDDEELADQHYVDTVGTANPSVDFEVWIPGDDGPLRYAASGSEDRALTLEQLSRGVAEGSFEGTVRAEGSSEDELLSGRFVMALTE